MYLVLGTYDHLCVRCLSNQSNQQGNHHEWSSRHSAYATVAATSLVSLYLVSHNFCFIQYITVKHNFIIFVWNLKVSIENWWYSSLQELLCLKCFDCAHYPMNRSINFSEFLWIFLIISPTTSWNQRILFETEKFLGFKRKSNMKTCSWFRCIKGEIYSTKV